MKTITKEEICRAACKANGLDYDNDEDEDICDAVRVKIWTEGVTWMQNELNNPKKMKKLSKLKKKIKHGQ